MFPRRNYEMTEADLEKILDASKPTVCIKIGEYTGSGPQENANRAWDELARRMGFDPMTVKPCDGMGSRFFTALPTENEAQHKERVARQAEEEQRHNIGLLQDEITRLQAKLTKLLTP